MGRQVSEFERSQATTIYKDLDFLNMQGKIILGGQRGQAVLDQIQTDCQFLNSIGVMDYPLLLGIHQVLPPATPPPSTPLASPLLCWLELSGHMCG